MLVTAGAKVNLHNTSSAVRKARRLWGDLAALFFYAPRSEDKNHHDLW